MLKKTLQLASEGPLLKIVIGASVPRSAPELEALFKKNHTRRIIRQEGLSWVIDELLAGITHLAYISNSFKPATILANPDLYGILLASLEAKAINRSSGERLGPRYIGIPDLKSLVDSLQRTIVDPTDYLVIMAYHVFHRRVSWIQKNYGLQPEHIRTLVKGHISLRIEFERQRLS